MEQIINEVNSAGYTREQILHMKQAIKFRVAQQKSLKNQRKTVHFKGERTLSPSEATWKHQVNRWELRHMYLVYAKMRGKDISHCETIGKNYSAPNLMKVEEILKTYLKAA